MEMQQLRYFVKVAELGSLTRAAEHPDIDVSQPTLSQSIANLEKELKTPVFERLSRGVRLTPAGEILLGRARQILALAADAKGRVGDTEDAGTVSLGVIPTAAPYLLPRVLATFAADRPGVTVEVHEDVTEECLRKCQAGRLDMALLALPVDEPNLDSEVVYEEELLLAVPPGHRLAGRRHVTAGDIAEERLILLSEAHCLSRDVQWYCRLKSVSPASLGHAAQLETVLALVALGQGVSFVPESAARPERGCVYLPFGGDKPRRTLALVRPKRRHVRRVVTAFRDCVAAHVRP